MLVSLVQNIIACHCTSDVPCWNKHGSLLCRDSYQKEGQSLKLVPHTWETNPEGRCWIKAWRLSAEQEAEKLPASIPQQSWVDSGENASTFWLANLWKECHLIIRTPNKIKKVIHFIRQASQSELRPGAGRARECVRAQLLDRNCTLGLMDLHLAITSWYVSP